MWWLALVLLGIAVVCGVCLARIIVRRRRLAAFHEYRQRQAAAPPSEASHVVHPNPLQQDDETHASAIGVLEFNGELNPDDILPNEDEVKEHDFLHRMEDGVMATRSSMSPVTLFGVHYVPNVSVTQFLRRLKLPGIDADALLNKSQNFVQMKKLDPRMAMVQHDVLLVLFAFTYDHPTDTHCFHLMINNSIYDEPESGPLRHFQPFIYALTVALDGLRPYRGTVYKGARCSVDSACFQQGERFLWPHFSSATKSEEEALLKGPTTLFIIEVCTARDISDLSAYPEQEEVILLPNTVFVVTELRLIANGGSAPTMVYHLSEAGTDAAA